MDSLAAGAMTVTSSILNTVTLPSLSEAVKPKGYLPISVRLIGKRKVALHPAKA